MKILRTFAVATATFLVATSAASAQSVDGVRSGIERPNLVSANPIGLLFEWYNGEFEHALNSTVSLAVAASSYDFDGPRYNSIDGIARYYPSARALKGFSVGMSVGYVSIDDNGDCLGCYDESGSSATLGVRGDYVWILGRDQRFAVATGIGAKRLLSDVQGTEGLPIGRLSLGYAF